MSEHVMPLLRCAVLPPRLTAAEFTAMSGWKLAALTLTASALLELKVAAVVTVATRLSRRLRVYLESSGLLGQLTHYYRYPRTAALRWATGQAGTFLAAFALTRSLAKDPMLPTAAHLVVAGDSISAISRFSILGTVQVDAAGRAAVLQGAQCLQTWGGLWGISMARFWGRELGRSLYRLQWCLRGDHEEVPAYIASELGRAIGISGVVTVTAAAALSKASILCLGADTPSARWWQLTATGGAFFLGLVGASAFLLPTGSLDLFGPFDLPQCEPASVDISAFANDLEGLPSMPSECVDTLQQCLFEKVDTLRSNSALVRLMFIGCAVQMHSAQAAQAGVTPTEVDEAALEAFATAVAAKCNDLPPCLPAMVDCGDTTVLQRYCDARAMFPGNFRVFDALQGISFPCGGCLPVDVAVAVLVFLFLSTPDLSK